MPSDSVFSMIQRLKGQLQTWLRKRHVKSFVTCIANTDLRLGAQALFQSCGLGKLRPNIVIMGFKHNWTNEIISIISDLDIKNLDNEHTNFFMNSKLHTNNRFLVLLSEINEYFVIIQYVCILKQ